MRRRDEKASGKRSDHPRLHLEALEPRILLTTLTINDPFETSWFVYRRGDRQGAFDGDLVRIELRNPVTGVGSIEVIGINPETGDFANVPGIRDFVDVFGGLAGEPCGTVIGGAPYTGEAEISALASDTNPVTDYYYAVSNNVHFSPGGGVPDYDAAVLVRVNADGSGTQIAPLQDDTEPTFAFNGITALDFDNAGTLWGIGWVVDTLPPDNTTTPPTPNPPDQPVTGNNVPIRFLLNIDTTTGVTTRVAQLTPPDADISTIAYDPANDYFLGVNAGNDHLVVVSKTGVIADIGALHIAGTNTAVTGMTGLEFDETGTLYGVAGGNLYEVNPADGACTLTGDVGIQNLSALAYAEERPDYLWSIESDPGGADRLVRIIKKPPKPMDPYAIYVAEADQYTEILISNVIPYQVGGVTFYDDVHLWDPQNTPYITTVNDTDYYAPGGSGAALIGAHPSPTQSTPYRFVPYHTEYPVNQVPTMGVFPGGELAAGITVAPMAAGGQWAEVIGTANWTGFTNLSALAAKSPGAADPYYYAVDNSGGNLVAINSATGAGQVVAPLSVPYTDITGLDFDSTDTLWAVGTNAAGELTLLTIDTSPGGAGTVTPGPAIYDAATMLPITSISTIAFQPGTDILYAVVTTDNTLRAIDTATGAATQVSAQPLTHSQSGMTITGMTGLDFLDANTAYGIANGVVYTVDPISAYCTPLLNSGVTNASALAYDGNQPDGVWTLDTFGGYARLVKISFVDRIGVAPYLGYDEVSTIASNSYGTMFGVDNATGTLITISPSDGTATPVAALNPAYSDVHALDFDSADTLWAVGRNPGADLALVTINTSTGAVTEVATISPGTINDISTIAFDPYDLLYGVNPDTNELLLINTTTGAATVVGTLTDTTSGFPVTGMSAMDFDPAGNLYGVADGWVYYINEFSASCTRFAYVGIADPAAGTFNPNRTGVLWGVESLEGPDRLIRIPLAESRNKGEVGYLLLGGTLAGRLEVPNSVEVAQVGFLYGNVDIGGDLRTLYVRTDAGGMPAGDLFAPRDLVIPQTAANSMIRVAGTIGDIHILGTMYGLIDAGGQPGIPDPDLDLADWNNHRTEPLIELEGRLPQSFAARTGFYTGFERYYDPVTGEIDYAYLPPPTGANGFLMVRNDSMPNAQYLASETGDIILWGYLYGRDPGTPANGDDSDFYAVPLEAGQTIRLHAYGDHLTDPRLGFPFPFYINVYGPNNQFVATFGPETVEDRGIGSRGTTQETLVFTAPEAGLYYVEVSHFLAGNVGTILDGSSPYTIFLEDAAPTTVGGMRIHQDYDPRYNTLLVKKGPEGKDLYVRFGNLGAVNVGESVLGTMVDVERGALVDFEGARLGHTPVADAPTGTSPIELTVRDNVGRVAALRESLVGDIYAGADTGHTRNPNANIQNIWSADGIQYVTDTPVIETSGIISASGSIGRIYANSSITGGSVSWIGGQRYINGTAIIANSDGAGDPGAIDLVEIGGDWGTPLSGRPVLLHGPNGNVRFVHVAGTIYEDYGGWFGPLNPTVLEGTPGIFNDDGGGVLSINPLVETIDTGQVDPLTGLPVIQEIPTTARYWIIDVDDSVGGVLARLEIDGDAEFYASRAAGSGTVEIGDFNLNGTDTTDVVTIGGGSAVEVDVYYLHGGPVDSLVNSTGGDIVSGNITGIRALSTGGGIGHTESSTGTIVPGYEGRPGGVIPVAFGWYAGRMNGLVLSGNSATDDQGVTRPIIESVRAGGAIRDLLLTGGNLLVESVVANSDRVTPQDGWDGIEGIVYVAGTGSRLDYINVGDGLADDGSAYIAEAGIFAEYTIGTVAISRRYEFINGRYRGLIDGSILAPGTVANPGAIERVIGTNGARLTAIVGGAPFEAFHCWSDPMPPTGWVGTVSFSGEGAAIFNAEITGTYINTVRTSIASDGIWGSYISAIEALPSRPAIGLVEAGGPGLRTTTIGATGGWIGTVRGLGPVADLVENTIESTDSLRTLSGRHIYGNEVRIPNQITTIRATGNFNANTINTGGISSASAYGDALGNTLQVAGPLRYFRVYGNFSSELILQGPQVAYLGTLDVSGEIGGRIVSAGKIRTIRSRTGGISADISTTEEAINGDIDYIYSALDFTGNLSASGSVRRLETRGNVGLNPELIPDHQPTIIEISGDLDRLYIRQTPDRQPAHLYSDLEVGGNIGTLDLSGGLFGDMVVNGNIGRLYVDENIGAEFDLGGAQPVTRGNVEVRGHLDYIRMARGKSILADFVAGGDVARIYLNGGNIGAEGDPVNIVSLYGDIPYIYVRNGSIFANLSANDDVGRIYVRGGSIGSATTPVNITAEHGGIERLDVSGGGIFTVAGVNIPTVDAINGIAALGGPIGRIYVNGGPIQGDPISAATSIYLISIRNGNLDADVYAGTYIRTLDVRGGNLTSMVNAETGIRRIYLHSDLTGAVIRSGGPIDRVDATNITNSIISSATDIGRIYARGNVTGSKIWAGHDVGADGLPNTADDNPLTSPDPGNQAGPAHSGDVDYVSIRGNFVDSEIGAGIEAVGGTVLNPAPDQAADGQSSVGRLYVRGDVAGTSGVAADTSTGRLPDDPDLQAATADWGNPGFDPNAALTRWSGAFGGANITMSLSGPGAFNFDPATGQIHLDGTTTRSSLYIRSARNAPVGQPIHIRGGDDDALRTISLGRGITLGNITSTVAGRKGIDGPVSTLRTYDINPGAQLHFGDDVRTFTSYATTPITPAIEAGEIRTFTVRGPFSGGSLLADAVGSMTIAGNLDADVTTHVGGLRRLYVRGGDINGDVTSRGPISYLRAYGRSPGGAVAGNVTVQHGDLGSFYAYDDVSGNIAVPRGGIRTFYLRDGNFQNPADPQDFNSIRSLTGVRSYYQRNGAYSGVLYTDGEVRYFSVIGGGVAGRVFAMDGIYSLRADALVNSLIASGRDMRTVRIYGDVNQSYILAGFDPGDDGYDADKNADDAWVDALTQSVDDTIPPDEARGGTIYRLDVYGDFRWSAVAAGLSPGEDGYIGNSDDLLNSTGYILRATIRGRVEGTPFPQESYGFSAATEIGSVTVGGQPLGTTNNVVNHVTLDPVGPPHITAIDLLPSSIAISFDQQVDTSALRTITFAGQQATVAVTLSADRIFGPEDLDVLQNVAHQTFYDPEKMEFWITLRGETWESLEAGQNLLLWLDGAAVTDPSGQPLDGEYLYTLPTGDGEPGGDFYYRLHIGDYGGSVYTALDLLSLTNPDDYASTTDTNVPMLAHNRPTDWPGAIRLTGVIGDDPDLSGQQMMNDVDFFKLDARAGDILYAIVPDPDFLPNLVPSFDFYLQVWTYQPGAGYVEETPDSLTGLGYYTETDTTYYISVCTDTGLTSLMPGVDDPTVENDSVGDTTGSYELILHLFNDGNSNFPLGPVPNLIGDTGLDDNVPIAVNSFGTIYAIDNASNQLVTINPSTGQATARAALSAGYTDIHALDFQHGVGADTLWAVGTNPASQIALLEISAWSGIIWQDIPLNPGTISDITSIAFDSGGNLYGVNADNNSLVTIDTTTGDVTEIAALTDADTGQPLAGVTGIDFSPGNVLYAVTADTLYSVDPATGQCTALGQLGTTALASLSAEAFDPNTLWAIDSGPAPDTLVRIDLQGNATQDATPLDFTGYLAVAPDINEAGEPVQRITAPDDVDLYSLGELPEGTPINVTLLTRTIGSNVLAQTVEAAVFNSERELIASLYIPPDRPAGGTLPLDSYTDQPIIEAYAPATDTYYVAVWGGSDTRIDADMPYQLSVQTGPPVLPVPTPPPQLVYLNFGTGKADYLVDIYGPATDPFLSPLDAYTFGFEGPSDTAQLTQLIVQKVQDAYAAYPNIAFTTQRPLLAGTYSTVFITSDIAPEIGTLGIAEQVDSLNSDPGDVCTVFGGEFASYWHADLGSSMDIVATTLANTAVHELGHLLGLNHQVQATWPPYLIMAYGQNDQSKQFGRGALVEFLVGYQDDPVLLRVIA